MDVMKLNLYREGRNSSALGNLFIITCDKN